MFPLKIIKSQSVFVEELLLGGKVAGQHNKIVNVTAKKMLAPEGLFRVRVSRNWIDDNGYFVIQIEFQPSIIPAMTIKNFSQKNLPFYGKISDNIINQNYFFALST